MSIGLDWGDEPTLAAPGGTVPGVEADYEAALALCDRLGAVLGRAVDVAALGEASRSVDELFRLAAFDEAKHPRVGAGHGHKSGQFARKPVAAAVGALKPMPLENGLYYRLHRKAAPFGPEHAQTRPLGEPPSPGMAKYWEPKAGYSAFWSPHHLAQYLHEMSWDTPEELKGHEVIAFRGSPVGEGSDGEPRVMPTSGKIEQHIPWADFVDRLEVTPGALDRWNEHSWGEGPQGRIADDGYRTLGGIRMTPRDQMPPDPGTRPIPPGAIRLWHYTSLANVDSIRAAGLQRKYARGDAGNGDLSDPSAGMWASTTPPQELLDSHDSDKAVVEYWATPDQISGQAESPWMAATKGGGYDVAKVAEWAKDRHHVIMYGDVPVSQMLDVHEPWQAAGRYMRKDDPSLDSYQWVLDDYAADPEHHPELEPYVKALRAMGRGGETPLARFDPAQPRVPAGHGHASGEFVKGPFFHGSAARLRKGTIIRPSSQRPGGQHNFTGTSDPAYAYATSGDRAEGDAWYYAELAANWSDTGSPRVYQVEPVGEHEADPNVNMAGDRRAKKGWRVVREVPQPEWAQGW